MSTIYLDPVTMDATAGAIGGHAREVENVVGDLETACSAYVPPHLAGWLAEELHDIALTSQLSALLYTVAALDTALRAQQISADQSLATAWPALDAPFGDLTTTPFGQQAALAGSTVVGGTDLTFDVSVPSPTSMTIGGAGTYDSSSSWTMTIGPPTWENDPLLLMASQLQDSNPGLSRQLLGVTSMLNQTNADRLLTRNCVVASQQSV